MHFVVTHMITVSHHEQDIKTIFRTDGLKKNLYKLTPICPRKENLMHKEGSFMNDGKTITSLYLKVKKQYVFCVMRRVSVVKEFNLVRHFDSKHGAKYAKFNLQEKQRTASASETKVMDTLTTTNPEFNIIMT